MKKLLLVYSAIFAAIIFSACQEKRVITTAMFEGKDLTQEAQILRDKKSKTATLKINTVGSWKLYAGYSVDSINFTSPILTGAGAGMFTLDVADSLRCYFQIETDEGKAILAEKQLPMEGGYNFRDLGGLRTKDGRYVKWGKLFRTDDLVNLTDKDLHYLNYIPIRTIVDFRAAGEIKSAPDKIPHSVYNSFALSIVPGNLSPDRMQSATFKGDELMKEMNELLVSDSSCISRYREFFQILEDHENMPIIYHCSAGKDRTGMGTALILAALGVEENTIMEDYMLSNEFLADKYAPIIAKYPQVEQIFTVDPEYLGAGLNFIKKEYGSIEKYLKTVLNVDIERMKELYLY